MADLFQEYKDLFSGKNIELSSPYMINRLLSFTKEGFQVSIDTNRFVGRIPKELLLLIYQKSLPKQKAPYSIYAKTSKLKEPKLISKICKLFNCRIYHAQQIVNIYRKNNIKIEETMGLKKGE